MNVYWSKCGPRHGNFGDKLTSLIFEYFGIAHVWSSPQRAQVFGIGSILEAIPRDFSGVVWTSGQKHETTRKDLLGAKVLALRGPETVRRTQLSAPAEIAVGDGGLLVDLVARPVERRYKLGIVPHFVDADDPIIASVAKTSGEIAVIDVCGPTLEVIEQIGQCEHILSSSLHGLIVADSLGIPGEWIELNHGPEKVEGHGFKFRDYFAVYGITGKGPLCLHPADNLDTLLPKISRAARPGLAQIKERLIETLGEIPRHHSVSAGSGASLNAAHREAAALDRLEPRFRPPPHPSNAKQSLLGAELDRGLATANPVYAAPEIVEADAPRLAQFFLDCIQLLRHLRSRGIAHRAITPGRLLIRNGTPVLSDFGWSLLDHRPGDATGAIPSPDWPPHANDVRAMGRVLSTVVPRENRVFAKIAELIGDEDPKLGVTDLDILEWIVRAAAGDLVDRNGARAVREVLSRVDLLTRRVKDLQGKLRRQSTQVWELQWALARYEMQRVIPAGHAFVLVDDGHFAAQEGLPDRRSHPFGGPDTDYAEQPRDDQEALLALEQICRTDASFIVFTWPAFWWLEHYQELAARLESQFYCVLKNERLVIFQLGKTGERAGDGTDTVSDATQA